MNHGNLGIRVYGGAYNMSSDWQENLDVMMLSLTRIQGDIDRIPSSRSRIMSMLKYIEDLGFQDSND
jgi:hypothetical protein